MTSQDLLHRGGLNETTPEEGQARWQKHVLGALWVLIGLLIGGAVVFAWADANGLLDSFAGHTTPSWPTGSWPVGWP
jgi:polyferredoxin